MPVKKFAKQDLLDLLNDDCDTLESLCNELIDSSRWSLCYRLVFKELETGDLYLTNYDVGATEMQDESPFEYEGDEIECHRVEAYEKTVIDYRIIK